MTFEPGGQSLPEFNPADSYSYADPYPRYEALRRHDRVYHRPEQGDWMLTRYDDMVTVLKSSEFGHVPFQGAPTAPNDPVQQLRRESQLLIREWIVLKNPPEHTRLRQVLKGFFAAKRIALLSEAIAQMVDDIVDDMQRRERMDIVADLAYPLPFEVIRHIMGIPREWMRPELQAWSHDLGLMVDLQASPLAYERSLLAMMGLTQFFRRLLAQWPGLSTPPESLITPLLQAQAQGHLSERELVANCIFLFVGGHLTTSNLIGNGMLALLRHPDQLEHLRRQPALSGQAVHEILRYDPPIQTISRSALADVEIAGTPIQAGQIVHCILAAANRDPERFSEPQRFDILREPKPHLAFGFGPHYCLGAHLSQLEGRIAIETLIRRFPTLKLAADPLEWEDNVCIRSLQSLPVTHGG